MARSEFTIVPATLEHAQQLAPRMRPEDAAEVWASSRQTPLESLVSSLAWSKEAHAALWGSEVAALFGIARGPFLSFRAFPWLLGSELLNRHPGPFVRQARVIVREWIEQYGFLEQAVDARYAAALRWAARVGFEVGEPQPFGLLGMDFCRITARRSHV